MTPVASIRGQLPEGGQLPPDKRIHLPSTLEGFREYHEETSIIVCGCGRSLRQFAEYDKFITIGVNDVGRLFDPTYLVVLNDKTQFYGDRFGYVAQSGSLALFTHLDLGVCHPHVVRFNLGQQGGVNWDLPNTLPYTRNSPYVAICLAALMGARRIGLIGVDFTDDHFFARTGRHPLAGQFGIIDREYRKLADALDARDVRVVNLSRDSRLTAFRKGNVGELGVPDPSFAFRSNAPHRHAERALNIVSYATTPVAGVPAILARCISAATPHVARCVWARNDYGNGVVFNGDVEWTRSGAEAEELISAADLIILHNGKVDPSHRRLLDGKPVITMAHNYGWNVDNRLVDMKFPGVVVGQYQATLSEFVGWAVVPNPVPLWEPAYQPEPKPEIVTIAYTPSGRHESYPADHKLYWHGKGYKLTLEVLYRLSKRHQIGIQSVEAGQISHSEALAMKRRAHIVIDERVTGSYHRNSLEGLAAGCVVVNGVGLRPAIGQILRRCAGGAASPFVFARLDELEQELEGLISLGPAALALRGSSARQWMERNWQFQQQWNSFWRPVVDAALTRSANSQIPTPVGRRAVVGERPINVVVRPVVDAALTRSANPQIPTPVVRRAVVGERPLSVVIPHGGCERGDLLAATLKIVARSPVVANVIVVEMDDAPHVDSFVQRRGASYVFIRRDPCFNRARATNVGTALATTELVLWLDNDLLLPEGYLDRAIFELRQRDLARIMRGRLANVA
jgi:hypothetical protein